MFVDLSVVLNRDKPVYPGDPVVEIKPSGLLEKDGYCDHTITIGTHVGTHIDAPSHMIEGGKTLDQYAIDKFVGRGVLIEVKDKKFNLEDVESAGIQKGDIVLFQTGLGDVYDEPEVYFEEYPALTEEIARYLIEKGVSMVGIDMCSPDHPEFPIHKLFLSNDVLIIENLTNLTGLIGKTFRVIALPLNVQIDGSPARVIAEIEE